MRTFCSFPVLGLTATLLSAVMLPLADAAGHSARGEAAPPPPYFLLPQDWYRSLMAIGHASEANGQKLDALADYTLAIESHALARDEQARALFDRGLLLDGMNRLGEAVADYNATLSMAPDFTAALNNRANAYRRLGRLADARQDYLASLAAGNPQSQYSYFGLGQIAEAQGDNASARKLYDRALAADPRYALAQERLAALASDSVQDARQSTAQAGLGSASDEPAARAVVAAEAALLPVPHPPAASTGSDQQISPGVHGNNKNPSGPVAPQVGNGHVPQVQLGAWRSREEAAQGWDRALGQAGDTLRGLSPRIVAVDLPAAGRFYRLRVSTGQTGPKGFCAALAAKGLDCFPARD